MKNLLKNLKIYQLILHKMSIIYATFLAFASFGVYQYGLREISKVRDIPVIVTVCRTKDEVWECIGNVLKRREMHK